jgi:NAD(P)-dependent dehydrogenase (short-subunit alcohol dehydrogenase family)
VFEHESGSMPVIALDGQVAVVTGAGRGLGRSYALELARRGAAVVVNDLAESKSATAVVGEIKRAGGEALASHHSVSTRDGARRIIDEALERFKRIDILINNAGVLRNGLFEDLTDAQIDAIFDVHLKGVFYVTQPAFKLMREAGYGRIVNISSNTSFGMAGLINYAAAKAGIVGLTKSLALEGAEHGILVNCVMPNATTPIMKDDPIPGFEDDARFMEAFKGVSDRYEPELIAPLVAFLASPNCTLTGEALSSLGGRYARVFYGVTEGWMSPPGTPVTAEEIEAHLEQITSGEEFFIPTQIRDEFEAVASRLARTV